MTQLRGFLALRLLVFESQEGLGPLTTTLVVRLPGAAFDTSGVLG